jgi:hypothetical protein
MASLDWLIELRKQLQAGGRDAGHHRAAVFGLAATRDEGAPFESVEKASNVRIAGDHAIGDFSAGQAFGRATQDAENVVLGGRKVLSFENVIEAAGEHVRGAQKVEERSFFGRGYRAPLRFGVLRRFHPRDDTRYNDYCQDDLNETGGRGSPARCPCKILRDLTVADKSELSANNCSVPHKFFRNWAIPELTGSLIR